jgi:nucleoside-diphosphate kinase
MSSDLIVGFELVAPNAIAKWREVIGPTDCNKARQTAPQSIRAKFGEAGPKNAVHGSDSRKKKYFLKILLQKLLV